MSDTEGKKSDNFYSKLYEVLTTVFMFLLMMIFFASFFINLNIDTNRLLLLSIIIVILLSYRFKEIQIPGLLKLSKAVESVKEETKAVKEETKELRQALVQVIGVSSSSIAKSNTNIEISNVLKSTPSSEDVTRLRRRIPEERRVETTDEQVIRNSFLRGDYLASVSLLWNFIYDELRRGLELRRISPPNEYRQILNLLQEHSIYDLDILDGVESVDVLYNALKSSSRDSLRVNREKLNNALEYGIISYYNIKSLNENIGVEDE